MSHRGGKRKAKGECRSGSKLIGVQPGARNPLEDLHKTAYLIAKSSITDGLSRDAILKAAAELRGLEDREIEGPSRRGGRPVACRPKCDHCCWRAVLATPIELAALADHIQTTWPPEKVQSLIERLKPYCENLGPQEAEGLQRFREACPLLEDGLCTAHAFRPASCHGYASSDADLCRMWKEAVTPMYLIEPPNEEDKRAQAIVFGSSDAFVRAGVPSGLIPMAPALLDHLENPGPLEAIVTSASRYVHPMEVPWRVQLSARSAGEATLPPTDDPVVTSFERRSSFEPVESYLPTLRRDRTVHLMLRMLAPQIYRTAREHLDVRARIEQAIDDAFEAPTWNAKEAYANLGFLNLILECYAGLPMRPLMERIGKLFTESVANVIAPDLMEPMGPRRPGKVRIGLASYRMHSGSPAGWALGWVKNFDRQQFEITVINLDGTEDPDSYRFKDLADRYLHLSGDNLEMARYVRALDLDYLIYPDLGDGGWNFRYAMFRLARRQAAAWGCPFTSGLPTMDDYLTSGMMEPDGADAHYSEKLVRLPNTGVCYPRFLTGLKHLSRQSFGLPDGHLILIGQSFSKWTPQRDEMLGRISAKTKNPIVVNLFSTPIQQRVFGARLDNHGFRAATLPKMSLPLFLRLAELCDVSLDPPDFSGGHTTYGVLQVGTPTVTLPGEFMRGRQGLAYVTLAGAPGLVAKDEDDYVDLATNPERLREASKDLNAAPLFDDVAPVRAIEQHILTVVQ